MRLVMSATNQRLRIHMFSPCGSTYSLNRFLLGILAIFVTTTLFSQPFGNEWINYSQSYYKFPVAEEGVYRISYNALAGAGVPLGSIDPRTIQVYTREAEVPVFVSGEEDGVFGLNDYIELYAKGNDGWLDALVYDEPESQVNEYYSLFNDTIHYYLTWQEGNLNNLRYENEENQETGGLEVTPFVWRKSVESLTSNYFQGELDSWGTSTSFYTAGEGWFGQRIGFPSGSTVGNFSVSSENVFTGAGAPQASIRAVAASNSNANNGTEIPNHHLQIGYGPAGNPTVVFDETFSGYQVIDYSFSVNPESLTEGATNVQFKVVDDLGLSELNLPDYCAVSNITLHYPMSPDLTSQGEWSVEVPTNGMDDFVLFQFQSNNQSPVLYQFGDVPQRIIPVESDGNWLARINAPGNDPAPVFVSDIQSVHIVNQLQPVGAAQNGDFTNFETFNVDSAYIIVSHKSLITEAQAYANHRNTRFNTFLVDVAELYDQFGGGIEKSGLAIRRFADMLLANWDTPPQYLFLIGKSIREAPDNAQPGSRKYGPFFARNLVPSFGYPPSDNLITVGLQGNQGLSPTIRTGRLAAETQQDVNDYLNKVIEFENQPPAEWMKNIMHFGGGSSDAEQATFQGYLEGYASTISDTCFGGVVHPFYKQSSDPIDINLSVEIEELINGGVSLMTFFGHAGGSGFDQSIDNPTNFDWNGKYPFLIGNACYTGDIHSPSSSSTSEDFLLLPAKGVIGFLSTVKLGFGVTLDQYSDELYKQIAYKNYGTPIGHQIKKTVENVENNSLLIINQVLGMTLHGDPGIVLNSFPKPDYKIEVNSVYFEPAEVTTIQDSLTVKIALSNIGKATGDAFDVIVERNFPDNGADSVYVIHVDQLYSSDTLSLTLPVQPERALGENKFSVQVDLPVDDVDELDDFGNNTLNDVPLLITNGGIIPVYPYKYAVVGEPEVTLKASTGNPFASPTNYRFQVDTTRSFDSPFLSTMVINQNGGLVQWPLPFSLTDSTVYFWRCAIDTLPGALKWRESSFQYIVGKTGWGQAHFQQFHENFMGQLVYNESDRTIDFFSGTVNLRCNIIGGSTSLDQEIALNLDIVEYGGCQNIPAIHVAVFDPYTFEYWGTSWEDENPDHNFGNANNGTACRNRVENYFIFRQNSPSQIDGFSDMVINAVPDGHYLLIYTWRFIVQDDLTETSFYGTMDQLGATIDPSDLDSIPYMVLIKKGESTPIAEMFGENITDVLELHEDLDASGNNGVMESVAAGPVAEWESFHYRFKPRENPTQDSVGVRLIGRQWNNANIDIPNTFTSGFSLDEPNLNNLVDAEQFPFLRIRTRLKDEAAETPAQLKRWHLLFDEVPEAVVNPSEWFVFESLDVEQGEDMLVSYAITNASTVDMDSLFVRYWVINEQNNIHEIDLRKIAPLSAGASVIDSISFDSWGLGGNNQFWLEVNATDPQTGLYDQIEQYHFNNFLQIGFDVSEDNENPLLDVTFDGLHILDGEIVSTNPEINIALTDENEFLLLDQDADTSNFEIFFAEPGGEFERHYFYNGTTQNMIWVPASGNTNKFQIIYRPEFKTDGIYTMLVRGTDKSGNTSGDNDYRINFEVITQSTITDVLNYPNPFSTKTHFVFTLTGSQVPDYMKIQIMTISGKIVKEITNMELGPIRVGRNITDYYWDGTDMYGDRLANGIYIYRVIAKINGETITKRETAAGKYFKQEFGKMYLMR